MASGDATCGLADARPQLLALGDVASRSQQVRDAAVAVVHGDAGRLDPDPAAVGRAQAGADVRQVGAAEDGGDALAGGGLVVRMDELEDRAADELAGLPAELAPPRRRREDDRPVGLEQGDEVVRPLDDESPEVVTETCLRLAQPLPPAIPAKRSHSLPDVVRVAKLAFAS